MLSLTIPKNHIKGFVRFISLPYEKQKEIIRIFKGIEVGFRPKSLIDDIIANKNLNLQKEDAGHIVLALLSLFSGKDEAKSEADNREFVKLVVEALKELEDENFKIRSVEELQSILFELIESDHAISLNNKAISLTISREKILTDTRIISDIRPIFSEDGELELIGSVITHNLKIDFAHDLSRKETYYALDIRDLEKLKEQINRALEKEQLLRRRLEKLSIPFINLSDEK